MSPRKRYDENGEYLLPSEREGLDFDDSDELEIADRIKSTSADELEALAKIRDVQRQQASRIAPHVRIVPPSADCGTLGTTATVKIGEEQQVAQWSADSPIETLPITIIAGPVAPPNPSINSIAEFSTMPVFRSYGIIRAGSRGYPMAFEFDLGPGIEFSLNASMVSLSVALEKGIAPWENLGEGTLKLGGALSYFPPLKNTAVTRTKYVPALDAAGVTGPVSYKVNVPAFARNVVLWRQLLNDTFTLDFLDSQGNSRYSWTLAAGTAGAMLTPIPVTPDIYQIQVSATGGGNRSSSRLVFGLGF